MTQLLKVYSCSAGYMHVWYPGTPAGINKSTEWIFLLYTVRENGDPVWHQFDGQSMIGSLFN